MSARYGAGQRLKVTVATATKWGRNDDDNEYDACDKGTTDATAFAPRQRPVARRPPLLTLTFPSEEGRAAVPRPSA